MALFSQRKGIRPLHKAIQREEADEELRNGLWNAIDLSVWRQVSPQGLEQRDTLCSKIWHSYLKLPLDKLPPPERTLAQSSYADFRDHFFEGEWWEVYDFLEFVVKNCQYNWAATLTKAANIVLENENAAYRIVGTEICDISDEHEINAIEDALASPFDAARIHLEQALALISDKQNPDYRNAVKEAISAAESAAKEISGHAKGTLGDCIKVMEKSGTLHPAFKKGLLNFYGYTNDSGGIRHALTEDDAKPTYSEAKFMLVTCAAFVNLLAGKRADDPA